MCHATYSISQRPGACLAGHRRSRWKAASSGCYANVNRPELPGSEAHVPLAEISQIVRGGASFELHLEILVGEVRRATAGEEGGLLALQVGGVLGTVGRGADVDDVAVTAAFMLILDGVDAVAVPPHRIARID